MGVIPYNKTALHQALHQEARILGAVSILVFSHQFIPAAHAELELEGVCYPTAICYGRLGVPVERCFHEKVYALRRGVVNRMPFFRIALAVTPQQLCHLRERITTRSIIGMNCMLAINDVLKEHAHFQLPLPFSVSPAATLVALSLCKFLGSRRVVRIEPYVGERKVLQVVFRVFWMLGADLFLTACLIHDLLVLKRWING